MNQATFRDAAPLGTMVRSVTLLRAIAQGGEGIVYEARHPELGDVLVKEFWPKQIVSRARSLRVQAAMSKWQEDYRRGVERFIALGERLQALPAHPNLMTIHEVFAQNNTAYAVMERVPGRTLEEALEAGAFSDPADIERLAAQLGETIEHLHGLGLLHRDIAPDNIIITPGQDWRAVLIDFSAAKDIVQRVSRSSEGIVKPGYTPSEQYDWSGSEPVGPWTDIYSASAVLHRCIAGEPPADPTKRLLRPDQFTPLAKRHGESHGAKLLTGIDAGLQPRPDDRPQTAQQWLIALGFGEAPPAPPPPEAPPLPEPAPPVLPVLPDLPPPVPAEDPEPQMAGAAEPAPASAAPPDQQPIAAMGNPNGASQPDDAAAKARPFRQRTLILAMLGLLALIGLGFVAANRGEPRHAAAPDGTATEAVAGDSELAPETGPTAPPPVTVTAAASPAASIPAPAALPVAQCKEVCTGGEDIFRTIAQVKPIATLANNYPFNPNDGQVQAKAKARAASLCGGEARYVVLQPDGECSGDVCFGRLTAACVKQVEVAEKTERVCTKVCDQPTGKKP